MVVIGRSPALILRVTTAATAQEVAPASGRSEPISKALVPGRMTMRTPRSPTKAADQRRHPTTSPSSGIESAVIRIGEMK
jgi:hypothetical protein